MQPPLVTSGGEPSLLLQKSVRRAGSAFATAFARRRARAPASREMPLYVLEIVVVPLAGLEPALLAVPDFELGASTNSATGAPAGS